MLRRTPSQLAESHEYIKRPDGLGVHSFGVGLRSVTVTETVSEVRGRVSIGPPKTKASTRTVALPSFLADDLALPMGKALVFTAPQGGPIRPGQWRRRFWAPAVRKVGLEGVTFHALRHSQGALLVAQREHPLVVARRLGHKSVRTVLDVYGHLLPNIDSEAAGRLDDAVRAAHADRARTRTVLQMPAGSPQRPKAQ